MAIASTNRSFYQTSTNEFKTVAISCTTNDFEEVRESIRVFQDMLEVDVVTHSFKNVNFADNTCSFCGEDNKLLR